MDQITRNVTLMTSIACSADMAFTSSHTPRELGNPGVDPASDAPIAYMQDIIEHEYALVESIPNEERAALMPIIRFVRNTLQDPFKALRHCWTMDALKLIDKARMGRHDNHRIDTDSRFSEEVGFLEKRELQGPHSEDAVGGVCGAPIPCTCLPNGTNNSQSSESCQISMPVTSRHSPQDLYQQMNCQCALHKKEAQNFDSRQLSNPHSHYSKHDNDANPHRGGFFLSSLTYPGLSKSHSLASFKVDSESNLDNICSNLDMDSFNLEELRRSLRPPAQEIDSEVNDIQTVGTSNCSDGDDDDMHEEDGNDDSYLYYPNQDEEPDTSDVEWPLYWGNSMRHRHNHQTTAADNHLRFPKVHCRRRNITKKAVGWIKKRAAQFLVSRVRHKRKCNLPCCTDCEMGTKRRKASGYGPRKCPRLSTTKKIASSLTATASENAARSNRQLSSRARTAFGDTSSSESCDDKEASQVTQDLNTSPLAAALTMVLMNSKGCGLTSCEALQALVQVGYLRASGYGQQAFASDVKTTLKNCPLFQELKNHRFVLRAGQKLPSSSLHCKVTFGSNVAQNRKFLERELSVSQALYSEKRERSLSQIVDRNLSCEPCQQGMQCHKALKNKPGFSCAVHHLQSQAATTATSGCSSCEVIDSCDASNERRQEAKEEDALATSCSGQSAEEQNQDQDRAEPIRCCRTDGKSWQCSNQAQAGSTYCERHQSRCKKGMVKRHVSAPCESKEKGTLQSKELAAHNHCVIAHERNFSMQLRPRSGAARDISLKKL